MDGRHSCVFTTEGGDIVSCYNCGSQTVLLYVVITLLLCVLSIDVYHIFRRCNERKLRISRWKKKEVTNVGYPN